MYGVLTFLNHLRALLPRTCSIMNKADALDACTGCLTTLAEVVKEGPNVRARMHSIRMQAQIQSPGAASKENTQLQSTVTPVIPRRNRFLYLRTIINIPDANETYEMI